MTEPYWPKYILGHMFGKDGWEALPPERQTQQMEETFTAVELAVMIQSLPVSGTLKQGVLTSLNRLGNLLGHNKEDVQYWVKVFESKLEELRLEQAKQIILPPSFRKN